MASQSPASQLADIRRAAGLTQRELAELSGVAQPDIAAYENGTRHPSPRMLARPAAAGPRASVALARHKAKVKALAAHHKALSVKVFGSVARGEHRPGSDLDLLVTFAPDASLFDRIELARDLEDTLGVKVDVVSADGLRESHASIAAEAKPL
ncbi:helix-turn-helix domain-containing protein [Streptomyces alkaliphilus]|uniref:Helix-turn-helix domain-containing protein n=1 Tax=Streptomyces alkaliphilus TaxID=1472722 RepID=A0A7W3Y2N8_9ACTN|nr:nucleotidyltransferase domain-containing protein [Streptomyces alkaliphilus]MBB0245606.1 helix-turn-helix domain-containing protein [Streptomyces alkaliphilus]